MMPSNPPQTDAQTLSKHLENCAKLCTTAEAAVDTLSERRLAFLNENLGDALAQLELILRVISENSSETASKEARQGLLSRLFGRSEASTSDEDVEPPSFDVPQEGLQGNTWTVPMGELLSFLAYGKKTGVLWVDGVNEKFLVGLEGGRLMHATSDHTPEGLRLGEILVGMGFLTRRQLERYLQNAREDESSVSGEALLEAGMISTDELRTALSHQVGKLFIRLIHTQNAVFRFREGMKIALAYQVDLDVNSLLLDSARAEDEAQNADLRNESAAAQWNSWKSDLTAKIAPVGGGGGSEEKAEPQSALPAEGEESPLDEAASDEKPAASGKKID